MNAERLFVRDATRADLPRMGELAEALVRYHHELDPRRFFMPDRVAEGYRWWFGRELDDSDALLLVATEGEGGAVLGYAYGRVEAKDWNQLLDRHAALHDILVDASARLRGVAEALLDGFVARVRDRGVPRVVLHTAVQNERAQSLFKKVGFRPTMIEMTLDL